MKTQQTIEMENKIYAATRKIGIFGCFEVTIGIGGKERVDYITYDTKGIFRCYEIKVSKSDFHSNAIKSFVGHYNYYVMPYKLYEEVKDEIPKRIGVYADGNCVKNSKKQDLKVDADILKNSIIRSLYRDSDKLRQLGNEQYINKLKRTVKNQSKIITENDLRFFKLCNFVRENFGREQLREFYNMESE